MNETKTHLIKQFEDFLNCLPKDKSISVTNDKEKFCFMVMSNE